MKKIILSFFGIFLAVFIGTQTCFITAYAEEAEEENAWKKCLTDAEDMLQTEANAFGTVMDKIVEFDVTSKASAAINIFDAAGVTLLTLFFCMEAFTYCAAIDFNGGIEGAIRIGMKLVVSALIVSNVGNIVGALSGILKSSVGTSFGEAMTGIGTAFGENMAGENELDGGILNINYLILALLTIIIVIIMFILFSMMLVSLIGVLFETAILTAISPVALATLVNSQARSTGISFIKNFAAVSMQWGVLKVCLEVYKLISSELTLNLTDSLDGTSFLMYTMRYAAPVLCVVVLTITVTKASEITKRALGG